MTADSPSVVVLAGPNGAGKTTSSAKLLKGALAVDEYVNVDIIAQGISGFNPDRVAIEASEIMLQRLKSLAEKRVSFGFETTLSSRSFAPWIKGLIEGRVLLPIALSMAAQRRYRGRPRCGASKARRA